TTQPFQGWKPKPPGPRVAADGNPGLDDATPSGLNARCPNQVAAYQYTGFVLQPWTGRRNPFRVGMRQCQRPNVAASPATLACTTQPFQGWDAIMPNSQGSR